jgi:hypothetical protein
MFEAGKLMMSASMAVLLAGCAYQAIPGRSPGAIAQATPVPRVQNCAVLNTGTPSRFACNGKVYTSFQLAKIREDEATKSAAGK